MKRADRNLHKMIHGDRESEWAELLLDDLRDAPHVLEHLIADDGTVHAPDLSPQEKRVLERLSHGDDRQQAADGLGLSIDTVKTHLKRAKMVLRTRSTVESVAEALRLGLILAAVLVALVLAAPAAGYYADGGSGGNQPDCTRGNVGDWFGPWLCVQNPVWSNTEWVWEGDG